jgi:hypothetical protein
LFLIFCHANKAAFRGRVSNYPATNFFDSETPLNQGFPDFKSVTLHPSLTAFALTCALPIGYWLAGRTIFLCCVGGLECLTAQGASSASAGLVLNHDSVAEFFITGQDRITEPLANNAGRAYLWAAGGYTIIQSETVTAVNVAAKFKY